MPTQPTLRGEEASVADVRHVRHSAFTEQDPPTFIRIADYQTNKKGKHYFCSKMSKS